MKSGGGIGPVKPGNPSESIQVGCQIQQDNRSDR